MKRLIFSLMIVSFFLAGLSSCAKDPAKPAGDNMESTFEKFGTDPNTVELSKLNDKLWVHTTYENIGGYKTPSNGLLIITSKGLVLVDTPWNNEQTEELLEFAETTLKKEFTLAIITHAHQDRIGGIDTLLAEGIEVRSIDLTMEEAEKNGFAKPTSLLDDDAKLKVGDIEIETYYPGEGHSRDNITVWLPKYKVLFGGCLVKSMDSNLGSITDANLDEWPNSMKHVLDRYSDAEVVIPGHGQWGSLDLVKHTLELLDAE